ncbi:MAG: glycerate kinase, partial [Yaniella sp.]|uniref:glycerate kinase n=1 Tax=Yaniella sp. TaxID=2773929 RepID=UPI003F9543DE
MTNTPRTNTKPLNVLLVPDSYKGSLSSSDVARALAEGIYRAAPDTRLTAIPMADGGEGTVDALVAAANGERHELQVTGPEHLPVTATYGQLADGAVIEMAAAAGLPLTTQPNPETTTTYGVGQLIDHLGDQNMMIGAGGSATNDLGCGAAAACGVTFYDVAGQQFVPTGATLSKIASIDMSQMRRPTELTVMTDIDNPLLGDNGAAAIFAPQKGADPAMVQRLERGAAHAAN